MTDDERATVDRFLELLRWMRRLERMPTLAELNSGSALCRQVRGVVQRGADVEELMLDHLGYITESLLLWPGVEATFREWLRATADYMSLRVSAL